MAITGSVARGDASPGSDVDLWVLGNRSGKLEAQFEGASVTFLCQPVLEAFEFQSLCLFEVEDLKVVRDEHGLFQLLARRYREQRSAVRGAVLDSTAARLEQELGMAQRTDWLQPIGLRELALRFYKLRLFLSRGWRVPKLRQVRAHTSKQEVRLLDEVLGLPAHQDRTQGLLNLLPQMANRAAGPQALPGALFRCWSTGAHDDALVLLRDFTLRELAGRPGSASPDLLRYLQEVHADDDPARTLTAFRRLMGRLKLEGPLPNRLKQCLARARDL